jgi:hypothetical protein
MATSVLTSRVGGKAVGRRLKATGSFLKGVDAALEKLGCGSCVYETLRGVLVLVYMDCLDSEVFEGVVSRGLVDALTRWFWKRREDVGMQDLLRVWVRRVVGEYERCESVASLKVLKVLWGINCGVGVFDDDDDNEGKDDDDGGEGWKRMGMGEWKEGDGGEFQSWMRTWRSVVDLNGGTREAEGEGNVAGDGGNPEGQGPGQREMVRTIVDTLLESFESVWRDQEDVGSENRGVGGVGGGGGGSVSSDGEPDGSSLDGDGSAGIHGMMDVMLRGLLNGSGSDRESMSDNQNQNAMEDQDNVNMNDGGREGMMPAIASMMVSGSPGMFKTFFF